MGNSLYERDYSDQSALKRPGRLDFRTLDNVDNAGDGYPGVQKCLRNYLHEGGMEKDIDLVTYGIIGTSVNITNAELQQLSNIGASVITSGDWTNLASIQNVSTSSSPTFVGLTLSANLITTSTVDGIDVANHDHSGSSNGVAVPFTSLSGDIVYTQLDSVVDTSGVGSSNKISHAQHVHNDDGSSKIAHANTTGITTNDHHDKQHSLTSTANHTSTATSGRMLKADANGLPINATNTDTDVASAVSLKHAASHTIASHNDTTATGANLNTLTGGGNTTLHGHAQLHSNSLDHVEDHNNDHHTTDYKADFSENTGFNRNFGTISNTVIHGNDSRLTNERTPTNHVLSGSKHTASGLTTGYVIKATGTTTFAWQRLSHADLSNLHQSVVSGANPTFGTVNATIIQASSASLDLRSNGANSIIFSIDGASSWEINSSDTFKPMDLGYDIGTDSAYVDQIYACNIVDKTCADFTKYSVDNLYNMFSQMQPRTDKIVHKTSSRTFEHIDFDTVPDEFAVFAEEDYTDKYKVLKTGKDIGVYSEDDLEEVLVDYKVGDKCGIQLTVYIHALKDFVVKSFEKIKHLENEIELLKSG